MLSLHTLPVRWVEGGREDLCISFSKYWCSVLSQGTKLKPSPSRPPGLLPCPLLHLTLVWSPEVTDVTLTKYKSIREELLFEEVAARQL